MQLWAVSHRNEKDLNSICNLKIIKLTLSFFRSRVGEVKVQSVAMKEQQTHSVTHREVFRYYSHCQTFRRRSHLLPLPKGLLASSAGEVCFISSGWDEASSNGDPQEKGVTAEW